MCLHFMADGYGGGCEALATCLNLGTCSEASISGTGAHRVAKFGDSVQLFVYFLIL